MISVALTGGIGSGKSTVAELFASKGAFIVDADAVAREVTMPGGSVFSAILDRFGAGVVGAGGCLDRQELARIVFADPVARRDLESLTHPAIMAGMARRVADAPPSCRLLVLEVPLLAEVVGDRSGGAAGGAGADGGEVSLLRPGAVVVVDAPEELVLRRLETARQMSRKDVLSRIAVQATREQRLAIADFVIDNSSSIAHLRGEVDRVWERVVPAAPERVNDAVK